MRWISRDEEATLVVLAVAALGLAVLGLLSGCAPPGASKSERLIEEVTAFNNAVRWDRREEALLRLPPAQRTAFLDRQEEVEDDVRIDDWELDRAQVEWKQGRASFRVHFLWHRERESLVKKSYVEERWRRMGKRWLMVRVTTRVGDPVPTFEPPDQPLPEVSTQAGAVPSPNTPDDL